MRAIHLQAALCGSVAPMDVGHRSGCVPRSGVERGKRHQRFRVRAGSPSDWPAAGCGAVVVRVP